MKTKVSPTLVGLFVLGALVLGIVALFSFGGIHFLEKPQKFMVYFDESIHGLDLGSPVKLRGVRVGRVVSLNVRYSPKTNQSVVAVVCELNRDVVYSERGDMLEISDSGEIQKLIDRGLRARLGVLGLATGMLFVELDFLDPALYVAPAVAQASKYPVVPAVPSAISELQASISEILADIRRINFAEMANDIGGLLKDTRKQVNSLDLASLNAEWVKAGQSVNALASSPEFKTIFAKLDVAISQLTRTLANVDAQVEPAGKELTATLVEAQQALKSFNEAAAAARNFIAAQSGLGDEATRALGQLGEAAASIQRLVDFIERNPNALLIGKKPPR